MPRPPKRDVPHLIASILPRYGVHLIGGPSGAGKTTWLFQFLEAWSQRKPVLGLENFPTIPAPWAYISCDRPPEDTWHTIDQIGFKPDENLIFHWDEDFKSTAKSISGLQDILRKLPITSGLLCIDDLAVLMGDGDINNPRDVRNFMRALRLLMKGREAALLGCVHSPKMKPGDEYKAPRQRISGSAEWGHYGGTIFLLEQDNDVGSERTFWFQPRHHRDGKVPLLMGDGRLVEADNDIRAMALEMWLISASPGQQFPTAFILRIAEENRLSTRTAERWLRDAHEVGKIEIVKKGLWRKTIPN